MVVAQAMTAMHVHSASIAIVTRVWLKRFNDFEASVQWLLNTVAKASSA